MSKISQEDLEIRYKMYRNRVKEVKRTQKETEGRAIALVAIEYRVSVQTIKNAIKNRPIKAKQV